MALVEAYRARRPREFAPVSLGYRTVELVLPEQLQEAQLGYAVDPSGQRLTGFGDGDWSPYWLVIAIEDETGDPVFVDTSEPSWPVYTAAHGEGAWVPAPLADSFGGFLAALEAVRVLSRDRETPAGLERRPISTLERDQLLGEIRRTNLQSDLTFWETWLEAL